MRRLLLATHNRDKARELRAILSDLDIEIVLPDDLGGMSEPEETGLTFAENALLKARASARFFRLPAAADDSGLEVDALGGRPGVYSARYAGPGCSYADNNAKLLVELGALPGTERGARFVCVAALVTLESELIFTGVLPGVITAKPRGENGFGYDPIFVPEGETRTLAEMTTAEKNALSHRGRAFRQLRAQLVAAPGLL